MITKTMNAPDLRSALLDEKEIALIDVREQGPFGSNHLLLAVNIPLSQFDLVIGDFVP